MSNATRKEEKFDVKTREGLQHLLQNAPDTISEVVEAVVERGKFATQALISIVAGIAILAAGLALLIGWWNELARVVIVVIAIALFTNWARKRSGNVMGPFLLIVMLGIGWVVAKPQVGTTITDAYHWTTGQANLAWQTVTNPFRSKSLADQYGVMACDNLPPEGSCRFVTLQMGSVSFGDDFKVAVIMVGQDYVAALAISLKDRPEVEYRQVDSGEAYQFTENDGSRIATIMVAKR